MNALYYGDNLKILQDRSYFPDASVYLVYARSGDLFERISRRRPADVSDQQYIPGDLTTGS